MGGDTVFKYIGCCVDWNYKSLAEKDALFRMVDIARDITYQTFIKHVPVSEILSVNIYPFNDYYWKPGKSVELRLKDDFAVSFHSSWYMGKRVYYMRHSSIEYIFREVRT